MTFVIGDDLGELLSEVPSRSSTATYLIPLSPNSHNNQLVHVRGETASGPSALSTGCSLHSDPVYLV